MCLRFQFNVSEQKWICPSNNNVPVNQDISQNSPSSVSVKDHFLENGPKENENVRRKHISNNQNIVSGMESLFLSTKTNCTELMEKIFKRWMSSKGWGLGNSFQIWVNQPFNSYFHYLRKTTQIITVDKLTVYTANTWKSFTTTTVINLCALISWPCTEKEQQSAVSSRLIAHTLFKVSSLSSCNHRWSTTRAASLKSALRRTATIHMLRFAGNTAAGKCLFRWMGVVNRGEVTRLDEDTHLLISCLCSPRSGPSLNSDQQLDGSPPSED